MSGVGPSYIELNITQKLQEVNQSGGKFGDRKYICITEGGVLGVTTDKTQKAQIQDIENFVAGKLGQPGLGISVNDKSLLEGQLSLLHSRTWKSLPWLGLAWIGYLFVNKVGSQAVSEVTPSASNERRMPVVQPVAAAETVNVFDARPYRKGEEKGGDFDELRSVKAELSNMKQTLVAKESKCERLEGDLALAKEEKVRTEASLTDVMSMLGSAYTKRDLDQTHTSGKFPNGNDIKAKFIADTLQFDAFTSDALNCLAPQGSDALMSLEVRHKLAFQLTHLHRSCERYVIDLLDGKKTALRTEFAIDIDEQLAGPQRLPYEILWNGALQTMLLGNLEAMTDEEIETLFLTDEDFTKLASMRKEQENDLDMKTLARLFLKYHLLAELSVPKCVFEPSPGQEVAYDEKTCKEVASPSPKRKYGSMESKEKAVVLFPGLYFCKEGDPLTKTVVVPSLVMRDDLRTAEQKRDTESF